MKCKAKVCSRWATIPNIPCKGEMVEIGVIGKSENYGKKDIHTGGINTTLTKLYQCPSCKRVVIE